MWINPSSVVLYPALNLSSQENGLFSEGVPFQPFFPSAQIRDAPTQYWLSGTILA